MLVKPILNLLTISEIQTPRFRELLLVLIRINGHQVFSVTESTKKLQVNHVKMNGESPIEDSNTKFNHGYLTTYQQLTTRTITKYQRAYQLVGTPPSIYSI